MEEVAVSVICITYNHKNYIRRALDGVVSQRTNFKFEVIVHDDASTDGTADIVREYAEKYPDIIKPIFQFENQYSKGKKIIKDFVFSYLKGKYVAFCEGDDYWYDVDKLQLQFDALERNPQCVICSHYVEQIDSDTKKQTSVWPEIELETGILSREKQVDVALKTFMHFNSMFVAKSVYEDFLYGDYSFVKLMPVGDMAMALFFAEKGNLFFIHRKMSVYNHGVQGSWTERVWNDKNCFNDHLNKMERAIESCKTEFASFDYFRQMLDYYLKKIKFEGALHNYDYGIIFGRSYQNFFKLLNNKYKVKLCLGRIFPKLIIWYDNKKSNARAKQSNQ